MMTALFVLTAALSVAIGYALRGPEVSEMRAELCNAWIDMLHTRKERDAADARVAALIRENNALYAALLPTPEQPESIAAQTAAKIAAAREEEANVYGVEL